MTEVRELIQRLQPIVKRTRATSERGQLVRVSVRWLEMVARGEDAPIPTALLIQRTRACWNLW